ncbi:ABC transporter ATP-binding protein [Pseudoleptotrichia goodfellowii]|uniref:ABC transporter, ATP-binding protein n=1 Tax=Pseudoleptotrichia goodfellowii TaxID=157692 RepID=A0A510JEJ4_9FUSO|nr:ATP-binding cassette domain-containing protein [Pseudoleptotrichia goodfellowii]BBM36463.1 ABC transporter, ATP-binding protein [Pseudoleptotrichia goodfellowii]
MNENTENEIIKCEKLNYWYQTYEKSSGIKGTLQDLWKRKHKKAPAVIDVDISINKGEIVGLLGPNGAGKTTLIKLLTGILELKSGEIKCLNKNPYKKEKEYLKNIGVVMGQKSQLIWDLPSMETLKMLKEIYEIEKREFEERLEKLLKLLNLKEKINIPVRKLSLGERIKFELICSLIHKPEILFLDEPTIGLDITSQYAVYDFLKEVNKTENTTIILTSHYMKDIEKLCERVIIILKGEKHFDLTIDELKQKFITKKTYIVESKNEKLPFEEKDIVVKKFDNNTFEIYREDGDIKIDELNLKDIVSIKENTPELEDIIFELFTDSALDESNKS